MLPRRPMKPCVNLRLDAALLAQLEAAARAQKTTKTDILEQALRCYLDPDRHRSLEDRLMERMDSFEKRLGQLFWAVDLGVETTGHFVLYWLTRTDPIPESERDIAHALGQRRFDHFINQIAKKLHRRRSLVQESLRWEQSEPEEAKPQ
jgi:predicted transcriptional regulator